MIIVSVENSQIIIKQNDQTLALTYLEAERLRQEMIRASIKLAEQVQVKLVWIIGILRNIKWKLKQSN